jgi:NADPH2 dehydrogenase
MSLPAAAPSPAFRPLQVGRLTLSSRVVLAPLTRLRAHDDHTPSDLAVEYYAQRASYPGTLLIAEGTTVAHEAVGWANSPGAWNAKQVKGWKKIVDAGRCCLAPLYPAQDFSARR